MRYFYAFKGQNATCGSTNERTGRKSTYGDVIAFSTRARRDSYVAAYFDNNADVFVKSCNKGTARQYTLGMSVGAHNEYMAHVDYNVDEAYNEYF